MLTLGFLSIIGFGYILKEISKEFNSKQFIEIHEKDSHFFENAGYSE